MAKSSKLLKIVFWVLGVLFSGVLLVGLFMGVVVWGLSTEKGKVYVDELLQTELSQAIGYSIRVENVRIQFPLSAHIEKLSVADREGVWLDASELMVGLLPTPTIRSHLVIRNIGANSLTLYRPPLKPAASDGEGEMDISILGADIGLLTIAKQIAGLNQDITGSLKGYAKWLASSETASFEADFHHIQGLPEIPAGSLAVTGKYFSKEDRLNFSALQLESPKINVTGQGSVDLNSALVNIHLESKPVQIENWVKELQGSATIKADITGDLVQPLIKADIETHSLRYRDRDVPDAIHHLTAQYQIDKWEGALETKSGDDVQLHTLYQWEDPVLTLKDIVFSYGKNTLSGNLAINMPNLLLDGVVKATLPDLAIFSEYLPVKIDGSANANAVFASQKEKQAVKIGGDLHNISIDGVAIASANVETTLPDIKDIKPQLLTINMAGIAYEDIEVDKALLRIQPKVDGWDVHAEATGRQKQPFNFQANGNVTVQSEQQWQVVIRSISGSYHGYPFRNREKINITETAEDILIVAPRFSISDGILSLRAQKINETVDAKLEGKKIPLSLLKMDIPDQLQNAKATIMLTAKGDLQSPQVLIETELTNIKLGDWAKSSAVSAQANVKDGIADMQAVLKENSGVSSSAQLQLPLKLSFQPFAFSLDQNGPINGKIDLGLDISLLAEEFLPSEHYLRGKAEGAFSIAGSMSEPHLQGQMKLTDANYRYFPLGVSLQRLHAVLTADGRSLTLEDFSAEDPQGNKITGDGSAKINTADKINYKVNLYANDVALINHSNAKGRLSGNISIQGDQNNGHVTGALSSNILNIYLPDRFKERVPSLNVVQTVPAKTDKKQFDSEENDYPIDLNITWKADNKVFVRGWGIDAELKGMLAVKGKIANPQIEGKLSTIRGRYEEFGKRFTLKQGELLFEGDMPPSPYLNIVASITQSGVEITPVLTGPLLEPELRIESSPSMPQEEALSILLFDKDPSKISPFQAAQLANSLAKLSGKGGVGIDPLDKARSILGVDDITVNPGDENASGTTVGVGKYIGDNVYLEVERGAETSSSKARVTVDVTPNISVESATGVTGDNSVGIKWKHDY